MVVRPLLFVDVDGVLNCLGPTVPGSLVVRHGRKAFVPEGTRERIHALTAVFDPVWCTAWGGSAHRFFAGPLGLGAPWPRLHFREGRKLDAIVRRAGRGWGWVDDHGVPSEGSCVVVTDPRAGLSDEDVATLLEFAG